jgi:hypothetical protein
VKPEHVVAIVLRLFAIALTLYTVSSFVGSAWFFVASDSNTGASVLVVVFTVLMLAAAFTLWRFPLWIASRLVRFDDSINRTSSSISVGELQTIAFTVLGIYLLFRAVKAGIYWVFLFNALRGYDIDSQQWASMLMTVTEFLLACFLVFGAEGLTVLISKVRQAGRDNAL